MVGVVMGSKSDWSVMRTAVEMLTNLDIPYEKRIISAHRTPHLLVEYAESAEERLDLIIAGAGGAAHLPGMLAALTTVPVLAVPIPTKHLRGMDSLLSIIQMPGGIPVGTFAIGMSGAQNSGLFAGQILAMSLSTLRDKIKQFRYLQTNRILNTRLPN